MSSFIIPARKNITPATSTTKSASGFIIPKRTTQAPTGIVAPITPTFRSQILTGPYISTQERSTAAKNILTSVTQQPAVGPLVWPKPLPVQKPVVSTVKPIQPVAPSVVTTPTTKFVIPPRVQPIGALTPTERANRSAVTSMWKAAQPTPKLYNPSIIPTFTNKGVLEKNPATQTANLMTGLDYFNRYAETALSTLGILTDTYAGYAWNKDTWGIAKQRIADSYSQIWSPPALTATGVPAAVGIAAGNILSLAGEAIVAWQMGKAVQQTAQQLQMTGRRIWEMGKIDEVLMAVDDLKGRVSAAGEGATVMPESQSYETLISSVAKASENPTRKTMGQMMSDYAEALKQSTVVPSTYAPETPQQPPTSALMQLADVLSKPETATKLSGFVANLPTAVTPETAVAPIVGGLAVPVGQSITTAQTVAPAPARTAIPAQATAPISRILPHAAEVPAVPSPVATISTRRLSISTPTVPTTQPAAQTTVRPAPSATTEPWQMTPDERQSKIAALQVQYKRELAVPLMSEGNISPMQVGQMSKDQLGRFQQDGQTRLTVEAQIQDLEHPELAKVRFDQNVVVKNQEQIAALQSRLGVLEQFGLRKNGMMRPSYQKEIDKVQTELSALTEAVPAGLQTKAPLMTTQEIVDAIVSGRGVVTAEDFSRFATENPNGLVQPNGELVKVVLSPEGPRVVKVVGPDGNLTLPMAKAPTRQVAPTVEIPQAQVSVPTTQPPTAPVVAPGAVTPVAEPIMQAATITPTTEVNWGKWKKVGDTEYRLVNEPTEVRQWGKSDFQAPAFGKPLQFKNDTYSYYLVREDAVPAKGGFSALPASYRVVEAKSGNAVSIEATEAEAIATARRALDGYGQSIDDRITELVALHGGVANPVTVTNAAPLPAGQTTSGEVAQTVTNVAPDFVTSGTGTTIPAEKNDIARITATFDRAASAMWSGKITPTTEGSYQKAFYDALVAAGVPKGALGWKDAIQYYKETRNEHGLANRLAKVAAAVEKYNNKILAEQMAKGREHAQMLDKQHVKLLEVQQADREKLAQSQREAAIRLREQQTNDRIASEIEVGKQKHIDRAVAAALAEKEANLAKTAERLHAEKALSARNKVEIASIVEYIENLDLRYMHAAEAKAIQEEAGAAGIELKHPFVAPGDTAFVWAMQNVGLHVIDSSVPLVEQQVLNLPELRALQAKVKAIADLSKEEKDVIKMRRQEVLNKEIDDCVAELAKHITEKNIPNVRTGIYHGPEKKSNIANTLDKMHEVPVFADIQFDRQQYLFQVIGGYRKGALYNSLYNKIYGADRATARSVNTDIALAHDRLVQAGITPKTMSKQRTLSNGIVVTQRDVIFAAVYAGNTNTLFKMMESNGWTEEDIRLSIESMSKEEVAWTNYMLDDMRMLYPQVSGAFAEINQGASLPDIMNYFPAVGEKGVEVALGQPGKAIVHPAEQMTLDSLAYYGWGQGDTMVGGKPSFVKHREGGKMVLQVDPIKTYFSYKESALDYINRAPVASSMRAIVADARFKDAFLIVAGEQRYKGLMEYVEAIANPSKALAPKNPVERAARVLRWNASAGTLSLRVSKAITAFMSYGLGFGRYSPTAMLYGTHKLMGDFHGSMTEIKQYAPLLYQRLVDPARWDAMIADAEKAWGVPTSVDAKRLANLGFAVGDTLDVASSFLGYTWSLLRQHLNDPAWTLERASYVAERDLLQTHTSRLVQDRPAIYRGTELGQALVAFTGEATSQSMALMFDAKSAYHGKTPKAKFIAEWFTLTMGVALMGMLADAVARGRKKKTAKESGFWDGIWGRFILANIELCIPFAGRWITGSLRGFTGANDIITLKAIDEMKQLIPDIIKGNFGKATIHLLRFIGFGVGIPVLGFDELKNWIAPDNAASPSSTTIQKPSKPTKPAPTVQKPTKP